VGSLPRGTASHQQLEDSPDTWGHRAHRYTTGRLCLLQCHPRSNPGSRDSGAGSPSHSLWYLPGSAIQASHFTITCSLVTLSCPGLSCKWRFHLFSQEIFTAPNPEQLQRPGQLEARPWCLSPLLKLRGLSRDIKEIHTRQCLGW
jgi:hypothetical protein